jgi:hypothetical protein
MGLVLGKIVLTNPRKPKLASLEVEVLADAGAVHLSIPQHVQVQLETK